MEDISKTTIGVLLILVVLTSVIGIWVLLNHITNLNPRQVEITQSTSQGDVQLNILKKSEPESVNSRANVQLNVLKPEEGGE